LSVARRKPVRNWVMAGNFKSGTQPSARLIMTRFSFIQTLENPLHRVEEEAPNSFDGRG
jgi:hypothetical protein